MKKKKIIYLVIGIVLLGITLFIFYFLKNKHTELINNTPLEEQQKLDMLKKLKQESTTTPISVKEKTEILNSLKKESTDVKKVSSEEKLKILNSLMKK